MYKHRDNLALLYFSAEPLWLVSSNEWRTYDNIRQGGLHPSWWWFSFKICGENAKFATSIATRAVLATPESTKILFGAYSLSFFGVLQLCWAAHVELVAL